jgi:glycosyltransferase involved in cell wall biosynthesis
MRLLFVHHLPWSRELGAVRIHVELAEALRDQGHDVDHIARGDVFPREARTRLGSQLRPRFSRRVRRHVAAIASRYDVIDAREGDLPFAKERLGFAGLLAARSVGLSHAYREFLEMAADRWPDEPRGTAIGQVLRSARARLEWPDFRRSWECADLVNLPNSDELRYLDRFQLRHKAVVLPCGLSDSRRAALAAAAAAAPRRLHNQEVAFIGYWSPRKGSRDFREIVRRTRRDSPQARFHLLGTGVPDDRVRRDLGDMADFVRITRAFRSDDLPALLADATAAAFPSYIEGFGIAVLEGLAAGLPTVAFDAPGPRAMLGASPAGFLVPPGDAHALAERLSRWLNQSTSSYRRGSDEARAIAARFRWEAIAHRTFETYSEALETAG